MHPPGSGPGIEKRRGLVPFDDPIIRHSQPRLVPSGFDPSRCPPGFARERQHDPALDTAHAPVYGRDIHLFNRMTLEEGVEVCVQTRALHKHQHSRRAPIETMDETDVTVWIACLYVPLRELEHARGLGGGGQRGQASRLVDYKKICILMDNAKLGGFDGQGRRRVSADRDLVASFDEKLGRRDRPSIHTNVPVVNEIPDGRTALTSEMATKEPVESQPV